MSTEKKPETFEASMAKLREMADQIQRPDVSLDQALKCYEEGMKCYHNCMDILDSAQQKIETEEVPR